MVAELLLLWPVSILDLSLNALLGASVSGLKTKDLILFLNSFEPSEKHQLLHATYTLYKNMNKKSKYICKKNTF